ncbi:MAG: glycosyltransferase [Ardenticatenaceae bacterium]|nr:glycosyltransferase [Ardenticatenaceae bacterium]
MRDGEEISNIKVCPKISVIVPAYNPEGFVREAVLSVLKQTYLPFEVIVISDTHIQGLESMVSSDHYRLVKHVQWPKQAVAKIYNLGIELAKGSWIAFLDGDDVWHPRKIEKQVKLLSPETGFIFCNKWFFDENIHSPIALDRYRPEYREEPLASLLKSFFASPSTVMIKKNVFEEVGIFKEDFTSSADYDLWIRIAGANKYRFDFVDEPLVYKRKVRESITSTQPSKEWVDDLMEALISNRQIFIANLNISKRDFEVFVGRSYGYLARKFARERDFSAVVHCLSKVSERSTIASWHCALRFFWKYTDTPYY